MRPRWIEALTVGAAPGAARELDPSEPLRVVSWNVHKGLDAGLVGDLGLIARDRAPHVLALQEARPDLALPPGYSGHHAASFRRSLRRDATEGVTTAATVETAWAHRVRSAERELFFFTPKAALISTYRVRGGPELVLINVHGLNFDPSGRQLARQMDDLRHAVAHVDGPLVIAGDFNTWNEARLQAVHDVAIDLGLAEIAPDVPGGRTGSFGKGGRIERWIGLDRRLHLDRIYARGLTPIRSAWLEECQGSDHVALFAELAFDRTPDTPPPRP